jgi:hypothetical protein
LSDILAFFLTPNERHGQKRLFVDLFLREFGLSDIVGSYSNVTVKREQYTDMGRKIDMVLFFDNECGVAIENKIWAGEGYNQINDYCSWLERRFLGQYCLIYLTPYGHAPGSISETELEQLKEGKKILLRSHSNDIINLIKIWVQESKAPKVRLFLEDFTNLIHHKVNGSIFMNIKDNIVDYILSEPSSQEKFEMAYNVFNSMEEVFKKIILTLKPQLEEVAKKHNLILNFRLGRNETWSHVSFRFPPENNKMYFIIFQWHNNQTGGTWGFAYTGGSNDETLIKKFEIEFGVGNVDKRYKPWFRTWDEYNYFGLKAYTDIQNGTFARKVDEKLTEILEKIKDI